MSFANRVLCVASFLFIVLATGVFPGEDINPDDYLDQPKVLAYIRRYTAEDMRDWLQATIKRSTFFYPYIAREIRRQRLPDALIFLPVVESSYNPDAISSSGAAGLWQFMMNSIAGYDLHVDEWIDERKDFWKATPASLKKLQYNYSVLDDWLLAIGAYNCGLGCVRRAIRDSGTKDFWELSSKGHLPNETVQYVPKFLAVTYIARNPEKYGIELPPAPNWRWKRIAVKEQVNIRLLAEKSNVPYGLLTLGNAELRYDVTPPSERPYHLKVPDIYTDVISRTLEGDVLALNKFHIHTIRRGDTLYALARHFGVSVDLIKHHNPGIEPRFLQIDTQLIIPIIREAPPAPVPTNTSLAGRFRRRTASTRYEVQAGDTLWDIARRFKVNIDELARLNTIVGAHSIHPGQVLKIPIVGNEMLVH